MERTILSKYDYESCKYYQIQGYLKAFEQFNVYRNTGRRFFFQHLFYEESIENTLLNFFEDESKIFNEVFDARDYHFDFHFVREYDWEEIVLKELYDQFFGVLEVEYKALDQSALYHRKLCMDTFIKMLKDFFNQQHLEVWSSGVGTGEGVCGGYFCENAVDFIFKQQKDVYLLHFGRYD